MRSSFGYTLVTDFQNLNGNIARRARRPLGGLYLSEVPCLLAPWVALSGRGDVCMALLIMVLSACTIG